MKWVLVIFSLFPLSSVWAEDPAPSAPTSGTVEYRQRNQKPDIYDSGWSHQDEMWEPGPGISILKTRNKTGDLVSPAIRYNFDFWCPGDSFLVGLQSNYYTYEDEDAKEQELGRGRRRFRFACAFLQTNGGVPLQKVPEECKMEADNVFQQSGSSTCGSNEFLGGMKGIWDPALSRRDHQYFSKCCQIAAPKGEYSLKADTCVKKEGFHEFQKNFGMTMCGVNQVIRKISTKYTMGDGVSDRVFSIECCSLKLEPSAP
ncbi:MAG: hypothetical protein HYW48_03935 [Deltaproteobacteria bacterium]|nr:hypothetical protein [Deltaproteobacteria bacterium]